MTAQQWRLGVVTELPGTTRLPGVDVTRGGAGVSRPRLGDEPAGGRVGGGGRFGSSALSGLAGLAHPGWSRQGPGGPPAGGTGRRTRPDRGGAGLPRGGRDRRQDRRPPGERVPGLARDPGGGRRGSRDRGGGGAGRGPGADRPGTSREVPGAQPGLRRGHDAGRRDQRCQQPPGARCAGRGGGALRRPRRRSGRRREARRRRRGRREPVLEVRVLAQAARRPPGHDDRPRRRTLCHPGRGLASHSGRRRHRRPVGGARHH